MFNNLITKDLYDGVFLDRPNQFNIEVLEIVGNDVYKALTMSVPRSVSETGKITLAIYTSVGNEIHIPQQSYIIEMPWTIGDFTKMLSAEITIAQSSVEKIIIALDKYYFVKPYVFGYLNTSNNTIAVDENVNGGNYLNRTFDVMNREFGVKDRVINSDALTGLASKFNFHISFGVFAKPILRGEHVKYEVEVKLFKHKTSDLINLDIADELECLSDSFNTIVSSIYEADSEKLKKIFVANVNNGSKRYSKVEMFLEEAHPMVTLMKRADDNIISLSRVTKLKIFAQKIRENAKEIQESSFAKLKNDTFKSVNVQSYKSKKITRKTNNFSWKELLSNDEIELLDDTKKRFNSALDSIICMTYSISQQLDSYTDTIKQEIVQYQNGPSCLNEARELFA